MVLLSDPRQLLPKHLNKNGTENDSTESNVDFQHPRQLCVVNIVDPMQI